VRGAPAVFKRDGEPRCENARGPGGRELAQDGGVRTLAAAAGHDHPEDDDAQRQNGPALQQRAR
jgi:hypothetical protein